MKLNKKYFKLTLNYEGLTSSTAFTKADLVEGDESSHKEEVISQAINHNDIAVDDDVYVKEVIEITEDEYWAGKKSNQ